VGINAIHPEYEKRQQTWKMIRDAIDGERAVKAEGALYLPVPPGMPQQSNNFIDGKMLSASDPYSFYLGFADFPEIAEPALAGFQGVVHAKPPTITVPTALEYLVAAATVDWLSMEVLWSTITREVLTTGRIGLLIDVDLEQKLRFVCYSIESLINWKEFPARLGGGAEFLVFKEVTEETDEKDPFKVVQQTRYRELRVNGGIYQSRVWKETTDNDGAVIHQIQTNSDSVEESADGWTTIQLFGKTIDYIPFMPINSMNVSYDYEASPMLPMIRRSYAIYRKTADYNRALYIKGDPQIVIAGINKEECPSKIGGEGIWCLASPDAKAWYLDIDGQGIPLMRQSIKDEYDRFDMEGGKLLATDKTSPESGEALRRRQMAQQVTLKNIIMSAGAAFEIAIQTLGAMAGVSASDSSILFSPDTDFAEPTMPSQSLLEMTSAKNTGAPISYNTMHELMRRGGLTEKTFEQEIEEIKANESQGLPELLKPEPPPVSSVAAGSKDASATDENQKDKPSPNAD